VIAISKIVGCGVLLARLSFAMPSFAGHPGSFDLNPRHATPGLRLELKEIPSSGEQSSRRYALLTAHYPKDVLFSVYTQDFSDLFIEAAGGFRVDSSGKLVSSNSGRLQRLEDLEFSPGPYPRGAPWNVAIASRDRSIMSFASIIPYPLTAQSGRCALSLELLNHRGDRFLISGKGFSPGEEVSTEVSFDGRIEQKRRLIAFDGTLPRYVISHFAIGTDRTAWYAVKGRSCDVVITYEWGKAALIRR
jgi:hypothetical protein